MRMKSVLAVSTLALMSAYALGASHAPAPWALDLHDSSPASTSPSVSTATPLEVKGWLDRTQAAHAAKEPEAAIDLTALRYFVSKNDLKRAAAEIRLIRVKHPDWSPPEDLFNDSGATVDESPMWSLFQKGDFEAVRAAIAERQERDASWRPSVDLVNKLTLAEASKALKEASDAQNWDETIRIASDNKMLLTCDYVDALWRTAEALVHNQDNARALAAYKYVLTNCDKRDDRVATLQKAIALLGPGPEIDDLVALGRRSADGRSEFEFVKWDRIRAEIGKATTSLAAPPPSEADVRALAGHLASDPGARRDDQKLLGWWWYGQKDYAQAEALFRQANQPKPDSKAAEGLVLTLKAENKTAEALTLAKSYADLEPRNRAVWANLELTQLTADDRATLTAQDENALMAALTEAKEADGVQALGWRYYRNGQLARARDLFETSLSWNQSEPAATGLVASLHRLGDGRGFAAALAKYAGAYVKVAELGRAMAYQSSAHAAHAAPRAVRVATAHVRTRAHARRGGGGWDSEADQIVNEVHAGLVPEALERLEARRARSHSEPAGLTIVRAWALYNAGRYDEARTAFHTAYNTGLKSEAQKGLAQLGQSYSQIN